MARRRVLVAVAAVCVLATSCGVAAVGVTSVVRSFQSQTEQVSSTDASPEALPETTAEERTGRAGEERTENAEEEARQERLPVAQSCDSLEVLVDPRHALPPDYSPTDLVYIVGYGVPTVGGDMLLREEATGKLAELMQRAGADGEELLVASAYRSYSEQQQTFAHFQGIYGPEVEYVSAPPGQSQHQLGTTVDFTNSEVGYQLLPAFSETNASRWLERNAWRYGFINTYPAEDISGTGRQAEAWEYRYVGKETAREIHESDLGLREYLAQNGLAPCRSGTSDATAEAPGQQRAW
ncbi:M15 family metallopeptidase [Rubrobacter radiotolerans]|nr:M15 family metallopeptidase [Rubrobacter radiotolerans]MDX5892962.1 M15 family metallopeptidase [Rubrobacter radiotolerans]